MSKKIFSKCQISNKIDLNPRSQDTLEPPCRLNLKPDLRLIYNQIINSKEQQNLQREVKHVQQQLNQYMRICTMTSFGVLSPSTLSSLSPSSSSSALKLAIDGLLLQDKANPNLRRRAELSQCLPCSEATTLEDKILIKKKETLEPWVRWAWLGRLRRSCGNSEGLARDLSGSTAWWWWLLIRNANASAARDSNAWSTGKKHLSITELNQWWIIDLISWTINILLEIKYRISSRLHPTFLTMIPNSRIQQKRQQKAKSEVLSMSNNNSKRLH